MIGSPNYETLTIDELFSKLKFMAIDQQSIAKIKSPTNPSKAVMSGQEDHLLTFHRFFVALSSLMGPSTPTGRFKCLVTCRASIRKFEGFGWLRTTWS